MKLSHERKAWVDGVMQRHADPDIEGYLRQSLNADV
jgi:hypothetical protein